MCPVRGCATDVRVGMTFVVGGGMQNVAVVTALRQAPVPPAPGLRLRSAVCVAGKQGAIFCFVKESVSSVSFGRRAGSCGGGVVGWCCCVARVVAQVYCGGSAVVGVSTCDGRPAR